MNEGPRNWSTGRKIAVMGNIALMSLFALALVFELNYLSKKHFFRQDVTFSREYELSDITHNVVGQISAGEKLEILYLEQYQDVLTESGFQRPSSPTNMAINRFKDMMEEYQTLSDRLIFERLQLERQTEAELSARIDLNAHPVKPNDVILIYKGVVKIVNVNDMFTQDFPRDQFDQPRMKSFFGEEVVTSTIRQLVDSVKTTVYFLSGHDELSVDEPGEMINSFRDALIGIENCDVKKLERLSSTAGIPADCGILVILSPRKQFEKDELQALSAYIESGGRLLIALEVKVFSGLEYMLDDLGVSVGEDIVVEGDEGFVKMTVNAQGQLRRRQIVADYGKHPITDKMLGKTEMWYFISRSLKVQEKSPVGVTGSEILMTSKDAWGETDLSFKDWTYNQGKDNPGPLALSVAVSKITASGKEARVVVIGTPDFLMTPAIATTPEFALNAVRWLSTKESYISIPQKDPQSKLILFSETDSTWLGWLIIGVIPGSAAFFGIFVWFIRRR